MDFQSLTWSNRDEYLKNPLSSYLVIRQINLHPVIWIGNRLMNSIDQFNGKPNKKSNWKYTKLDTPPTTPNDTLTQTSEKRKENLTILNFISFSYLFSHQLEWNNHTNPKNIPIKSNQININSQSTLWNNTDTKFCALNCLRMSQSQKLWPRLF